MKGFDYLWTLVLLLKMTRGMCTLLLPKRSQGTILSGSLLDRIVEAIAQLDNETTKTQELYLKAKRVETINLGHVTSLVNEEIALISDDLGHAIQQAVHQGLEEYSDSSQVRILNRSQAPLTQCIVRSCYRRILP